MDDYTKRCKIAKIKKELEDLHLPQIQMDELLGNEGAKVGVDSIKQKLNACVQVSQEEGLFSE